MTAIAIRLWEWHELLTAQGRGDHTDHTYCRECDTITTHASREAAQDAADAHQCDPERATAVARRHGPTPRWSDEELEILRTHSIPEAARLTGRTPAAVAMQRHRLGITHKKGWRGTRTHCKHGHELAGDNLYIQPSSGARRCRACKRDRRKRAS